MVSRTVYPEVPPKVEYRLTEWGQALCPALDAMLLSTEKKAGTRTDAEEVPAHTK
ncbi:HTH-type transcriptional activator HxlR [compost metagenome]